LLLAVSDCNITLIMALKLSNLNYQRLTKIIMTIIKKLTLILSGLIIILPQAIYAQQSEHGTLPPPRKLTTTQAKVAAKNYQ